MRTRKRNSYAWGILGAIVVAMMIIGPAAAQNPYPDPPPEFTDPDDPLGEMFNPRGGQGERPVLVIFAEFNDLTFDDTDPSDIDAAHLHERFFGGFPSVAGYFDEVSNGLLELVPAQETDASNNGAENDGIVSVSIDMNKSEFLDIGREAEQTALLEAADPYVDYSRFDLDDSDHITQDELIFIRQDVDDDPVPVGCGTARRPDPVTLDGVELGSSNKSFDQTDEMVGIDTGTDTNLMTLVHEIGHAAFDMADTRLWNIGSRMDLGGNTCNIPDDELFRSNAWHAMHLGWAEPTVVTESGFYEVPRSPVGSSFILYDPDKDTDHFFMVENRAAIDDTYDQGVGGTGLVVWRLDHSVYHPTGGGLDDDEPVDADGFITLIDPDGPGQAWSPTFDRNHDQRDVEGLTWRDRTPTDIAIRAISPADDVMRVYFDVLGPGLLLDPVRLTDGSFFVPDVSPGESNIPFSVPAMNTGDEADTFNFYFDDLPPGWDSDPVELDLDAGEERRAEPVLIPAADADTGELDVTIVGESSDGTSVREEVTMTVNVSLDITTVTYTGETYIPIGEPAGFEAVVTNFSEDDAPIEGIEVTFELTGPGGDLTATGTTNADGIATADPIIDLEPGDYDLRASTERFGKHAPGGTNESYRVPTVEERIEDLIDDVLDASLNRGIENSLTRHLEQALARLEDDRTTPACNSLQAFINQVEAQSGKHVPEDDADGFLHDVNGIRDQLEC